MHALLLLRLAAPISSWDTLREIARDSTAHSKDISDSEMANLMNRFEERRVQWVAASSTIEARARKSCAIPKATGWAELDLVRCPQATSQAGRLAPLVQQRYE